MFFEKELERIQQSVNTLEYIDDILIELSFIINEIENSESEYMIEEKKEIENIEQMGK